MADLTITAANVAVFNDATKFRTVQVGEAVTEGQPGYLLSGKYYKTDADTEAAAAAEGIFLTAAALDGYALFATGGDITTGATMTQGEVYCCSVNAGGICPYSDLGSGDFVTILFVAETTTKANLNNIYVSGIAKA